MNYEIQIDNGRRGPYTSIYTLNPVVTFTSFIQEGVSYRLKYRAQNFNGWGPLSNIAYIIAGTIPSIPQAPILVGSTTTSIYFLLEPPVDNGGSVITSYQLWVDTLQTTPSYTLIYSGLALEVDIDSVTAGLSTGVIYRFRVQAVNQFGSSDYSQDTLASLGSVPMIPNSPVKVELLSTQTSIAVQWLENND